MDQTARPTRTWQDVGIDVPEGARGDVYTPCPKCSSTRKPENKHKKCLSVTIEKGAWRCHNCYWSGWLNGRPQSDEDLIEPTLSLDVPSVPREGTFLSESTREYLESRKINWWMEKEFRLTETVSSRGTTLNFNYYVNGRLVNIKRKPLFGDMKEFRQVKGGAQVPYNLDSLRGYDWCVITEGEFDTIAVYQCGVVPVISLPGGAVQPGQKVGRKLDALKRAKEVMDKMKHIVLALDGDEPGKNTTYEVAKLLGWERCYVVEWPEGIKDSNEMLVEHGEDALFEVLAMAKENLHPPIIGDVTARRERPVVEDVIDWLKSNYDIRFNVVTGLPYYRPMGSDEHMKPYSRDIDAKLLVVEYGRFGGHTITDRTLDLAVTHVAQEQTYDPFEEYINSVPKWDGVDHIRALMDSIRTDDDALFRRWFPKWLVATVPAMLGRYVNDMVFTLQGGQYSGKTFFQANLLPTDAPFDLTEVTTHFNCSDRYDLLKTGQSGLIVWDEFGAYDRNEVAAMKAIISARSFKVNLKYETDHKSIWKRCSFAANTNPQFFLRDRTGDRRYLVFQCLDRDRKAFDAIDKKLLFGQVIAMYNDGFDYRWSEQEIADVIERNRDMFTEDTVDEVRLDAYVFKSQHHWMSVNDIFEYMEEIGKPIKYGSARTVGLWLTARGFKKTRKVINGVKSHVYYATTCPRDTIKVEKPVESKVISRGGLY